MIAEWRWREKFAEELKYWMNKRGYDQTYLSRITGISQHTISKYINAKSTPSAYSILIIANALGISSSMLIEFD